MVAFLIVIVAVLVVVAAVVPGMLSVRRKRAADTGLAQLATERGWHYEPQNNDYTERFLGFPFSWHRGADILNVFIGTHRGRAMFACDYRYTTSGAGYTTPRSSYHYTIVAVALPNPRAAVEITNRATHERDRTPLGNADIGLGEPTLDATYRMRAEDPNAALALLTPPLRELLFGDQRAHRWPLRFERADLLTWEQGPLDGNRLFWMLDYLVDVADRTLPLARG